MASQASAGADDGLTVKKLGADTAIVKPYGFALSPFPITRHNSKKDTYEVGYQLKMQHKAVWNALESYLANEAHGYTLVTS